MTSLEMCYFLGTCVLQFDFARCTECPDQHHSLQPEPHLHGCMLMHFGLGRSCTPSTCAEKNAHTSTSAKLCSNQPLILLQLPVPSAGSGEERSRRRGREQKKLNFQCCRSDSICNGNFRYSQPNWNLFDYPNKVQIASSRSITTTGRENCIFNGVYWMHFPNGT